MVDQEDTGYGLRTEKFFAENFAVAASYITIDEVDIWTIGAAVRF